MQWVDLSLPLESDSHFAPWWARSSVKHQKHDFGRRAMRWLFGIKPKHLATGTGWDSPLKRQAEQAKGSGRSDIFWAAHYVGVEREFCHMERLANLDKIPKNGFVVYAFPLKVKSGSAGPARVVAMVDLSLA